MTTLVQMLMCGKVTHKNLIDSSPLFREKIVYNLEQQGASCIIKNVDVENKKYLRVQ